ncbi:glucanase [Longimycelium tulufanense]|uniref:Glucanase n=1 Tax=Longimycelium tulufanense TaxID=907463 RepID=A0A8J3FW68_9PSEU|nr:glycoside hydrolase family 6 protein [Longimycelium tulufanense]GGM50869.1 glucanase [Longimycelium tulufanense]
MHRRAAVVLVLGVLLAAGCSARESDDSAPDVPGALYVDPRSSAARWVEANPDDPRAAVIRDRLASHAVARWIGPDNVRENVEGYTLAAARKRQTPVLVAYNIPVRDCNQEAAGGARSGGDYRQWAADLAAGIGRRPAIVIAEPDALIHLDCLSEQGRRERARLLTTLVDTLRERAPRALVYLDAGDGRWNSPETMAPLLAAAGIAGARGFALNVANYNPTLDLIGVAKELRELLSDRYGINTHFVLDTGRNGNPDYDGKDWCNPPDRRLGDPPVVGGQDGLDARLWVKPPGESDGDCGTAPGTTAGTFAPDLAYRMAVG